MKKIAAMMTVLTVMTGARVLGAEASLTLDAASAYVFRGSTYNDGFVFQPGLEVEGLAGLTLGVWANMDIDDYDGTLEKGEFSEVDLYASYALAAGPLEFSFGYTEFVYPMGETADREIGIEAGAAAGPVDLGLGVFYGLDGGIKETLYAELSAGSTIELGECEISLGAAAGYVHPDEGESGFSHYDLTVGVSYGAVGASLTYIGQIDKDVLPDVKDGGSYDVDLVGMLSLAFEF